ncbi:uncharacterized protein LOC143581249 [Bidens hawaiensis]|uniref:uncharacterized protein LOC143581249 n=1 Tax=Bidens hawaiensis TaxID=980011 RepID=UPI0040490FAF
MSSLHSFNSLANYSPPLNKKARLSFQPHPPIKVHEGIANTTTALSGSDNTASHQSTESRANMERYPLTRVTSLEERVDELCKARQPHCVKTEMPTSSDHPEDLVVEGKISSQSDMICIQGYKVKQSVAPILESIFKKHGDIASKCVFKPAPMRSSFLEIICEVVRRLQTNYDIDNIEEMEQQVLASEEANINVSWLRSHLETIHKRKEASKKCNLLMETKATAISVKTDAVLDLRERCAELVAAQERFEKGEKCVRVLHLVEKNLNDSILEAKGNIDSWARQPVL